MNKFLFLLCIFSLCFLSGCNKQTVELAEAPEPSDKPAYSDKVEKDLSYNTSPGK